MEISAFVLRLSLSSISYRLTQALSHLIVSFTKSPLKKRFLKFAPVI